ncbi:hypothetical protein [Actinoplanes utahensis]|uniref:Peptidoglycan-binding protein n=1 Tax=Actinoplanes utahensis TaxID=1869 RepID=A0A0A6U9F7_ACTUT|nr:hypothetical protein [Actinoplanes utahensis]KHD72016.1 hypothetical protein MB27_42660 [Actinoplanes utahensis]GIF31629.1 hypothetical protein Aut01nite_46150 [Actinoplanes utahensis]
MSDDIDRLRHEQGNIRGAYGMWGTDELAAAGAAGAAVPGFGGDPATIYDISANLAKVQQLAEQALDAVQQVNGKHLAGTWAGDTHLAATEAIQAVFTDLHGLSSALKDLHTPFRTYAVALENALPADADATADLHEVAGRAAKLTALGFLPDLSEYDRAQMAGLHQQAMGAIDTRVSTHEGVRGAGRTFSALLRDHAAGDARGRRLSDSPMTAIDEIVLAGAGSDWLTQNTNILSAAQGDRAAAALNGLDDTDRRAMMDLLSGAASPEHRAYLLKALAAGHPVGEVSKFNGLIAAHGDDPKWLASHLGPFTMDIPGDGSEDVRFDGTKWTQGRDPTCVAASTVAARGAVDPLYALYLTTGGHPDDPAQDDGAAFATRWKDETHRIYDDGRDWWQDLPVVGGKGMSSEQSAMIADEQIGAYTGARYENVQMAGADARFDILSRIEAAVDEGHPVPLSTRDAGEGHQLMVIGHQGDELQIYNPWGNTYWITKDEFARGDISQGDPDLPGTPRSVRLPQGVN